MYRVHRSTAARWLASARERLAELCRDALSRVWSVAEAELPELAAMVDSQMDLSLERILGSRS